MLSFFSVYNNIIKFCNQTFKFSFVHFVQYIQLRISAIFRYKLTTLLICEQLSLARNGQFGKFVKFVHKVCTETRTANFQLTSLHNFEFVN